MWICVKNCAIDLKKNTLYLDFLSLLFLSQSNFQFFLPIAVWREVFDRSLKKIRDVADRLKIMGFVHLTTDGGSVEAVSILDKEHQSNKKSPSFQNFCHSFRKRP